MDNLLGSCRCVFSGHDPATLTTQGLSTQLLCNHVLRPWLVRMDPTYIITDIEGTKKYYPRTQTRRHRCTHRNNSALIVYLHDALCAAEYNYNSTWCMSSCQFWLREEGISVMAVHLDSFCSLLVVTLRSCDHPRL